MVGATMAIAWRPSARSPATADIGHRQIHPATANHEPYVACARRPQPKASLLSVQKLSTPALLIGKHTSHYV